MIALLFVLLAAMQVETTPPPPEPPRPVQLPRPVQSTLPNGLRVVVAEKHGVPLVAARLLIASGNEADPPDLPGLAEMTAAMLTKRTTTRSAEQIARDIEVLGATLDSGADWDSSFVAVDVMSSRLPKAMGYMADVVLHPTFQNEELERLRQQKIDTIRVMLKLLPKLVLRAAAQVVYGDAPYGHTGLTIASAEAMKREDLIAFHDRYYTPANAILVLAGDVTPAEATRLAEEHFGSWKGAPPAPVPAREAKPPAPRVVIVDLPNAGQAVVVFSRPGLARTDPRYPVAQVMNAILGGGLSSRLSEEIRIKRGLSYGAYSFFEFRRKGGPFSAAVLTKNESAAEVAGLIAAEMKRIAEDPAPADEVAARKATLIGNFGRSLETNAGLAQLVGQLSLYEINLDEIRHYIESVDSVSPAQVQQFANELLAGRPSIIIAGDAKKFVDSVKKEFPDAEVIPASSVK